MLFRLRRHAPGGGILLAALVLAGCGRTAPPPAAAVGPPPLPVVTLAERVVPRERVWDGTVEAVHRATLSAQTSGRIVELPFDVNDYVPKGAVVARLTDVEQGAAVRVALAQVRSAQAAYGDAEAQYQRIAAIYARKLVSRSQYDQARAGADSARAALEAAQQNVRAAQQSQAYTVVRAPYAGIVTRRFVQIGEAVQPGQPLIAGISLNQLRVEAHVPQSDVAPIRRYARAWVLLEHGARRLEAARVIVFPYADAATHTFTVRLELPPADTGLNPGEVVRVAFMIGAQRALTVPRTAVLRRGEITGVYVVRDGRVALRQVRLGRVVDGQVEVISGLSPGEQVARDPLQAVAWLVRQHARKGA